MRQQQPVELIYPDQGADGIGCFLVPNATVLISRAPHPDLGKKLIDYLLSQETEAKLARSDAAPIPLHSGVEGPPELRLSIAVKTTQVNYTEIAAKLQAIQPFLKRWVKSMVVAERSFSLWRRCSLRDRAFADRRNAGADPYRRRRFSLNAYRALLTPMATCPLMGHSLLLSFLTAAFQPSSACPWALCSENGFPVARALTLLLSAPLLIPPMSWLLLGFPFWGERGFSAEYCRMLGRKRSPRHFSVSSAALSCL